MRRQSAHVDAGVLAELSAGIISGRRPARIHAHLAGCQRCARVSAGLSEVSVLLASVPPPAMPTALTMRLSAAIAEEAAARSGAADAPVPLAGMRPRNRLTSPVAVRSFAAAAAVCLLAAGGYTIVQLTLPGRSGHGPPPGASATLHRHAALTGPGSYHVAPTHQGTVIRPSEPSPASPPAFEVVASGTDYQPATLRAQVEKELGEIGRISAGTASGGPARHQPTAQQEACVQGVVPGVPPTLVDAARYRGHPATIIALAPGAGQLGQAWVAGPACSGDKDDILAHVRLRSAGG